MRFLLLGVIFLLVSCAAYSPVTDHSPDMRFSIIRCCGSMEPFINTGDKVWLDFAYPYENIKKGDVIDFFNGRGYILHRAVEKTEKGWVTKGDNVPRKDPSFVTELNFRSKLIKVERK